MSWFAVDDNAWAHPKFTAAGNAALGLWLRCGAYAAQHLTDGIVPGVVVRMCSGTPAQVRKLVAAGLWHEHGHTCPHPRCAQPAPGDYYMHDYLAPYNPTRREVEARRAREADKKRRYREGGAAGRQLPLDDADPGPGEDAGRDAPPPGRPPRRAAPEAPIPADWQPSDEDVQAVQLARADAGLPQLTPQQLAAVTRKFVRRMTDDRVQAAAWGGRWRQWAETERTEPAGGVVVPLPGAMTRSQQQRAGLDRLRNGGHSA
ncbi:hypothetical protein ACF1BE_19710 [Streptomyces sp. NPDC014991]|uniref:hypothetical protein n=1 Tax=Streptomyces sp. NPDC014991 TaxID=3364935 RepID=UPI0036F9ACF2